MISSRLRERFIPLIVVAVSGAGLMASLNAAEKPTAKTSNASKSKAKAADDDVDVEEPAADFSADVDEDLTALVVPAEMLGSVEKSSRLRFAQALRGLLKEGVAVDGAAAAKRHYEVAHSAVPADPRAAYAYGLAFLEQKNTRDALSQFRAAVQHAKAPFLPAIEAGAWIQFQRNEQSAGLSSLTDLAKRIEGTKDSWPTEHDRKRAAAWLGRMIGFLTDPVASPDHSSKIDDAAATIAKTLTGERAQAFEHGRSCIAKRRQELETLAKRPLAEVVAEMNARRQSARTEVQAADTDIKQIEEEIRDAKKPFERQIADASQDIRTNGQKVRTASKDVPEAEEQVEYYSIPQQVATGVRTIRRVPVGVKTRNENAQEKKAREAQLATAKQKLDQLKSTIDNAKQNIADARKQRDKAQSDLRAAIAAKQPELREARKRSHEAAAKLKEIEHAALSPEQIQSRVTALDAYVSLDAYAERNRLLATLKTGGSD